MSLLPAKTLDLRYGHPLDADAVEGVFDLLKLKVTNDCFDLLHGSSPAASDSLANSSQLKPCKENAVPADHQINHGLEVVFMKRLMECR